MGSLDLGSHARLHRQAPRSVFLPCRWLAQVTTVDSLVSLSSLSGRGGHSVRQGGSQGQDLCHFRASLGSTCYCLDIAVLLLRSPTQCKRMTTLVYTLASAKGIQILSPARMEES